MVGFVRIRQVESRPNLRCGRTLRRPARPRTTTVMYNYRRHCEHQTDAQEINFLKHGGQKNHRRIFRRNH